VDNVLLTFGQLELSGRDHVLLLNIGHGVVEQGRLVDVFLTVSRITYQAGPDSR
jgi:hypothetical protein